MPPDRADRRSQRRKANPARSSIPTGPSIDDAHEIRYFRRHPEDDPDERSPRREFLRGCDPAVRPKFAAVAKVPPHRFAGGGYRKAMHGDMTGMGKPLRTSSPR